MFNFTPREWGIYLECIDAEVPVDECPLDLTEEQKAAYIKEMEGLIADRKAHPTVPIHLQTTVELDW